MLVTPGSVQVLIDGVDRTALLGITTGPPLVIDFAGMSVFGAFSATADIEITFDIDSSTATIAGDEPEQEVVIFAEFTINASG